MSNPLELLGLALFIPLMGLFAVIAVYPIVWLSKRYGDDVGLLTLFVGYPVLLVIYLLLRG